MHTLRVLLGSRFAGKLGAFGVGLGLAACSPGGASTESTSDGEPSTGASDPVPTEAPDPPVPCNLSEEVNNPQVSLVGRVCGESVAIATRAGSVIHLGRSQASDPETEIRVIEVLDNPDSSSAAALDASQLLVNLALETGPEVTNGESEHELRSGVFSLCGFGTVVLMGAPVTVRISEVETGSRSGDITLSLEGLLVAGFSPQHGQTRVNACGGEVDIELKGRFVHQ